MLHEYRDDGNGRPILCHVSKSKIRDMDDIFGILNEEKDQIDNSDLLKSKGQNVKEKGRKDAES